MECITFQTFSWTASPHQLEVDWLCSLRIAICKKLAVLPAKPNANAFPELSLGLHLWTSHPHLVKNWPMKFAHTHRTQNPTKWSKIAPDSTNSTDLQPLTRKFVLKAISLLDLVHFLLKTRSFGSFWVIFCQKSNQRQTFVKMKIEPSRFRGKSINFEENQSFDIFSRNGPWKSDPDFEENQFISRKIKKL